MKNPVQYFFPPRLTVCSVIRFAYSLAIIPSFYNAQNLTVTVFRGILLEIANSCQVIHRRWVLMSVKQLRVEKGWTQVQLAKRAGISMNTVLKSEKRRPIQRAMKASICQALGVEDIDIVVWNPVGKSNATK
jgi:DNA-binding Xre family transcriptional regulator